MVRSRRERDLRRDQGICHRRADDRVRKQEARGWGGARRHARGPARSYALGWLGRRGQKTRFCCTACSPKKKTGRCDAMHFHSYLSTHVDQACRPRTPTCTPLSSPSLYPPPLPLSHAALFRVIGGIRCALYAMHEREHSTDANIQSSGARHGGHRGGPKGGAIPACELSSGVHTSRTGPSSFIR